MREKYDTLDIRDVSQKGETNESQTTVEIQESFSFIPM